MIGNVISIRNLPMPRTSETWLFVLVLAVLAVIALKEAGRWHLVLMPDVNLVRIEGESMNVDRTAVETIIRDHLQAGFFDLDIRGLETQLENLAWVKEADVSRVWPAALRVSIDEYQAVARWGENSLLSNVGKIFEPPQIHSSALPQFYAAADQAPRMLAVYRHAEEFLHPLGLQIQGLYESRYQSMTLLASNGYLLALGSRRQEQRLESFARFYHVIAADFAARAVCVDLRYWDGFAVNPDTEQCYREEL